MRTLWGVGLLAVLVHCLVDYHFQQRPVYGYVYFTFADEQTIVLLNSSGIFAWDDRERRSRESSVRRNLWISI